MILNEILLNREHVLNPGKVNMLKDGALLRKERGAGRVHTPMKSPNILGTIIEMTQTSWSRLTQLNKLPTREYEHRGSL